MNQILVKMIQNIMQFFVIYFVSLLSIFQHQDQVIITIPVRNALVHEVNYIEKVKEEPKKIEQPVKNIVKPENKPVEKTPIEEVKKPEEKIKTFVGRLTGYGPDCVGCSGLGNLACRTKEGKTHSLVNDGIYYNDQTYGKVRILSAATHFLCGTIMEISKDGIEPYFGIVLDRGFTMNKEWSKGNMFVDLAYEKNALAGSDQLTGNQMNFKIIRYGW